MNSSDPPAEYTTEELALLRGSLADTSQAARCPRCDGAVVVGYPLGGGTLGEYWQVDCPGCSTTGVVGNVPKSRRPPPLGRDNPPK